MKKRTRQPTDEDLRQVLRMRGAPPVPEVPVEPAAEGNEP